METTVSKMSPASAKSKSRSLFLFVRKWLHLIVKMSHLPLGNFSMLSSFSLKDSVNETEKSVWWLRRILLVKLQHMSHYCCTNISIVFIQLCTGSFMYLYVCSTDTEKAVRVRSRIFLRNTNIGPNSSC
jgi:hypothetical protein